MAEQMPEQNRLCFAFVLVNAPFNMDGPDRSLWRYAVPYMRFRHPDTATRHWVLSVGDAQKIMLDRLSAQPHSVLGEVHVYAHSSVEGSVWARLAEGTGPYKELTVGDAKAYRDSGEKAWAIASKGDTKTRVYLHGCHLGLSPDALRIWRDLFGGNRGFACAPTMFQLFAAGSLPMRAVCPGSGKIILEKNLYNLREVEQFVKEVVAAAPQICRNLRADFAEQEREAAMATLNAYLKMRYEKLLAAGEVTWPEAESLLKMRELFDRGNGIPITYLSRRPEPWLENFNEEKLREQEGAIFPWDVAQWKSHHHWEPRNPD